MRKLSIVLAIVVFVSLSMCVAYMQYFQCLKDGYSKTQCMMMLQAQGTVNQNVFGVTK